VINFITPVDDKIYHGCELCQIRYFIAFLLEYSWTFNNLALAVGTSDLLAGSLDLVIPVVDENGRRIDVS